MQEKEPRLSLLTWKSAAIVLASAGVGFVLGSREARERISSEVHLYYQGLRNVIKREQETRRSKEEKFRLRQLLRQVFPEGLRAER